MDKKLYLPIETTVRELDSKLLLSMEAAMNGYKVYIGPQYLMLHFARFMQNGVMLYKDATRPVLGRFKKLKDKGVQIFVHDEEGFVLLNDKVYMDARLRSDSIQYVDTFFTWGNYQANLVREVMAEYGTKGKVLMTGHPRLDILKPEFAGKLYGKKKSDKVILINTKLSESNHRSGPNGWIDILEKDGIIRTEEERTRRYAQKEHKKKLLEKYLELITELNSQLDDYKIIIRPHPSENKQTWVDFTKGMERVSVRWDESIGYWLNQSDVVLHTGCTTAIEGVLMGKPSITFKPIHAPEFDIHLPDSISNKAESIDEVIAMIKSDTIDPSAKLDALSDHLANFRVGEYAYKSVVEGLVKGDKAGEHKVGCLSYMMALAYYMLRNNAKKLLQRDAVLGKDAKFKTSLSEMREKASNLSPEMYEKLQVKEVVKDLYVIEKV